MTAGWKVGQVGRPSNPSVEAIHAFEQILGERDEWRARAECAEAALSAVTVEAVSPIGDTEVSKIFDSELSTMVDTQAAPVSTIVDTPAPASAIADTLPEVDDSYSHFVKNKAQLEYLVNGAPVITLCGAVLNRDSGHVGFGGDSDGFVERLQQCPRCVYIKASVLRR